MDTTTAPPNSSCRASRASYVAGCHCAVCSDANRRYQRERSRQLRRPDGRWCPWVDADEIADRIEVLSQSGVGVRTIAERAGVATSTVSRIRAGEVRRVRLPVATAIMSVGFGAAVAQNVDAVSVRRCRDALVAAGWDLDQIAELCGLGRTAVRLRSSRCHAQTRDRIEALAALAGARFRSGELIDPPLPPELFAAVSPALDVSGRSVRQQGEMNGADVGTVDGTADSSR